MHVSCTLKIVNNFHKMSGLQNVPKIINLLVVSKSGLEHFFQFFDIGWSTLDITDVQIDGSSDFRFNIWKLFR